MTLRSLLAAAALVATTTAMEWPKPQMKWSQKLPFMVKDFGDPITSGTFLLQAATLPAASRALTESGVPTVDFHALPQADVASPAAKATFDAAVADERRGAKPSTKVPLRPMEAAAPAMGSNATSVVLIFDTVRESLATVVRVQGDGLYVAGLAAHPIFYAVTSQGVFAMKVNEAGQLQRRWQYSPRGLERTTAFAAWPGKCVAFDGLWCTWYNTPMVALDALTGALRYVTPWFAGSRLWFNTTARTIVTTKVYSERATGADRVVSVVRADADTGDLMWAYAVNPQFTKVASAGDAIAVKQYGPMATSPVNLTSLDAATGAVNWLKLSATEFDFNVAHGLIYQTLLPPASSTAGITYKAHDPKTGRVVWATPMPTADGSSNCVAYPGQPLVLLQSYASGANYALDATTGAPRWMDRAPHPMYGILASLPTGPAYCFASDKSRMTCVRQ